MKLQSPRSPRLPRRGDRTKERETRYTHWEGIQPLAAADTERNFDRETEWNLRFQTLRTAPAARERFREGLEHLERSMAIETGVIEGLFNLTFSVTQALVRKGFHTEHVRRQGVDVEPEHLVTVLQDHLAAAGMVYDFIREDRPITKHAMRELHAQITAHQETHNAVDMLGRRVQRKLRRGVWKDFPNNPTRPDGTVHLYAPPEQVDPQLDLLLELYRRYRTKHHPLLTAAWMHYNFIAVHPFADGNGRTGRVLLNWHLIRAGWLPICVHRQDRSYYLSAMQAADAGDLSVLVDFLIYVSRKSVRMAMSDFPVEKHLQVLGPEDPDYVYRKEDGWRNGI